MARPAKEEAVRRLADLFSRSQAALVTDYRGLTVRQITQLRGRLREASAEYHVAKNTLTRRALEAAGQPDLGAILEGPSAIAFAQGDPSEVAKVLQTFVRDTRVLALKGGLLGGKVLSGAQVAELATLPSREVMIGMLLGGLQAPISGLVGTLQGMISGLVFTLQAVAERKGAAA